MANAGLKLRYNEWLCLIVVRQHFLCRYKQIRGISAPTNVPQIRLHNKSTAQWNLIIFPFVRQQQQQRVLQVREQEQARSETEDGAEFLAQAENIWIMLFNKWNCLHSPGFPSSSTFLRAQRDVWYASATATSIVDGRRAIPAQDIHMVGSYFLGSRECQRQQLQLQRGHWNME